MASRPETSCACLNSEGEDRRCWSQRLSGDRVGRAITLRSQRQSYTNLLPQRLTPSRNAIKEETPRPEIAKVSPRLEGDTRRLWRPPRPRSGDRFRSTIASCEGG